MEREEHSVGVMPDRLAEVGFSEHVADNLAAAIEGDPALEMLGLIEADAKGRRAACEVRSTHGKVLRNGGLQGGGGAVQASR